MKKKTPKPVTRKPMPRGKPLIRLFAEYDARANPSNLRHKESFMGWLRRRGYDPLKITDDEWYRLFLSQGQTVDDANDYLDSTAEVSVMHPK